MTTLAFSGLPATAQPIQKGKESVDLGIRLNPAFAKAATLDSILKKYAPSILPGVSIAVYSEAEGWWASAAGYANLEQKIPMNKTHLQYLQSDSKMYIAAEILLLSEKGKIRLETFITAYLPRKYSQYIKGLEKITVRMLLNHTSGIPEYNENPGFLSNLLMHPLKNFSSLDCVKAIANKDLELPPVVNTAIATPIIFCLLWLAMP